MRSTLVWGGGIHLVGCTLGGKYTWGNVHLEGSAPGGSIHSPHLPALSPIPLSRPQKSLGGFIIHVIAYILWEEPGVPRSYSIPILST